VPRRSNTTRAQILTFGSFRLFPAQNLLLEGDTPVRIGGRAFDILTALVERAGELVEKEELLKCAWPNVIVVEANLRVHIAGLRKLLERGQPGRPYIVSVVGRGYRFVAPVARSEDLRPILLPSVTEQTIGLPAQLTRPIGRADILAALSARLPRQRLITIVGPGGIGKTTVAVALAEGLIASYDDGVRFMDLAPIANPLLVASTLASALGLSVPSEDPVPSLIAFLRDKHILIVLDNCEHVIAATASLAESILKAAPRVNILTTSREPMRIEGEVAQRLAPLESPPHARKLTAVEALTFSAVQLFVERAAANLDGFALSDADATVVADICRSLDGLPLAIEFAASRVDAFGIRGLAALLSDRFKLLMPGRRTATRRHQTLGAMLDWSYEELSDPERVVLRRLAVFASRFTLESASAVVSDSGLAASEVIDQLANLVTKSLIVADIGGVNTQYRLLSTTRAYALQKLVDSGELEQVCRRHAEHFRYLVEYIEGERERQPAREWLASYGELIDDVRSALIWAFSPSGDAALGAALTVASIPLWTHLSLNDECCMRVEAALSSLDPVESQGTHDRLRLLTALGGALWYTRGSVPETTAAWQNALAIAEDTGNTDYQLRPLLGLWADKINRGENRAALALAERFDRIAAISDDVADSLVADRMIGYSLYLLGELASARIRIERMLHRYVPPGNRLHIVRFQFDQRVTARIPLAGILWLQGFPDQAMRVAEANIDEAREIDHALSLSYALAQSACPLALLVGDLAAAERFMTMLLEHPGRQVSVLWDRWGRCFKGVLLIRRGDVANGVRVLGGALAEFPENAYHMHYVAFLGELAEGLARGGDIVAGLATIDRALNDSRRCEENWCVAELLRIKGEITAKRSGAEAAASAEECFRGALAWASQQNALSWQLRVTTSLAVLWRDQGRTNDARELLSSTYSHFTEGFSTTDLRAAKDLLDALA